MYYRRRSYPSCVGAVEVLSASDTDVIRAERLEGSAILSHVQRERDMELVAGS